MTDITDVEAIDFSNSRVRTAADQLAILFYECRHLKEVKDSDADTATTIAIRTPHIRLVANLMRDAVQQLPIRENEWFNVGAGTKLNVKITNSAADKIIDGSPSGGRPAITGADVHNVMSRVIDIEKWLADQMFGGDGSGTSRTAMLNTIMICGRNGNNPLIVSDVNMFVDNRCGEIVAEYEATSNAKLNHLLAVSPNPRNPAA